MRALISSRRAFSRAFCRAFRSFGKRKCGAEITFLLAINMLYSNKSQSAYLLDPSGYIGTDGLFRLKPNGDNERALRIMQLNGSGTPVEIRPAPRNFMIPLYNIEQQRISSTNSMELETSGIDPDDYIRLPERLRDKYRSKTIGANIATCSFYRS